MSDEIRKALFALADRIEEANGKPISIATAAAYALRTALAQKPTPAVPDGWQLVPVERIRTALEAVQNAMLDAYSNAYQECCGRGQGQCCGDPDTAWSVEDQHIMNALSPAQRELSALLTAALTAPVAQEPATWPAAAHNLVRDWQTGMASSNEVCIALASALCGTPPAVEQPECGCCGQTGPCDQDCDCAEQPDTVAVPRHTVESVIALIETHAPFRTAAVHELRALLAGGAE